MYNPKGKYKIPVAGPTRITNEDFLINVICAQGVPKADIGSESDPYIFFWLEDSERNPRGCLGKSPSKDDAKNPWWYCIRNMGAVPRDGDALIVEMYDRDALGSDFLGFCVISASELDYTPKVFPMITPGYKKANCTVTLCIHQWTPPTERDVKHVFFIRHGESVWNEAQKDVNVGKMMNYDHPLNKEGIRQAQTLNAAWKNSLAENNRKIASAKKSPTLERTGITLSMSRTRRTSAPNESSTGFDTPAASSPSNRARTMSGIPANNFQQTNPFANPGSPPPITSRSPSVSPVLDTPFDEKVDLFVNSDLIFASPLTRAVETCVIALDGHPHLKENKVKLLSTCREIKGLGGLDTVGKCVGEETERRVACLLDNERSTEGEKYNISLDPYDTYSQWWFGPSTSEGKKDVHDRLIDFLCTLHYIPSQRSIIVVAHSFFFRTILQKYLHKDIARQNPELRKRVMKNASCLYLEFDFSGVETVITNVEFMFGGGLIEAEEKKK